ncbi:MAG TPA: 2-oxoacid:acceptor oxidoreductase family protein [Candidatus Eremiobacteraeota bacterium]|nr:MAG: Pyruvate synthase subunit PorC [bacterium ADurb.Bin363]HPZ08253.1 2-oxoacid:acceptor oxidoreductase family protein [Candidatus Eremiobacteraeota bacterium]
MESRQKNRYEIRLAGMGGQGLILAGIILAEAATIFDGKNAVQSQSYGPESRGGASRAEVIISPEDVEIDYPKVTTPDMLLVMSREAMERYGHELKPDGIIIIDSTYVHKPEKATGKIISIPVTELTKEKFGKTIVANIVALGIIVEITGIVSKDSLEKAVIKRVPRGTEELNKSALELGYFLAREKMNTIN